MPEKKSNNFALKELPDGRIEITFYHWSKCFHTIILDDYEQFFELTDLCIQFDNELSLKNKQNDIKVLTAKGA